MPTTARRVRLFVASPGDVAAEREHLSKVASEINLTVSAIAPEKGVVLEIVKWETHVHPGLGRGPQDVINRQIGDYDIFLGIMWKRFGTPTEVAGSGTEEEFRRAYATWEQGGRLPVMFYFCQATSAPPKSSQDLDQLSKVVRFREELSAKGLVWEYRDPASFPDVIRPHLVLVLSRMFASQEPPVEAAEKVARPASDSDISSAASQVRALASEYERLRETMPSGDARTRQMSRVESTMRSIALSTRPLLPTLTQSPEAGERLAAVATLQELPDPAYFGWLADRVAIEKPFIGFHATVALLIAARILGTAHKDAVLSAIDRARNLMSNLSFKDPNQVRTLESARRELMRPQ